MIGEFLKKRDIPSTSVMFKLRNGSEPLFLIDTLYSVAIRTLNGEDVDVAHLPLDVDRDLQSMLNSFKIFNIVDDVKRIVNNRLYPVNPMCNLKSYIKQFSNTYFRFRKTQVDCSYVIQAMNSELRLFAEMNDIKGIIAIYNPEITFRTTQRPTEPLIVNEVSTLKNIKGYFEDIYKDIVTIICGIQTEVLASRNSGNKLSELEI